MATFLNSLNNLMSFSLIFLKKNFSIVIKWKNVKLVREEENFTSGIPMH